MNPLSTPKEYQKYVNKKSPNSPIARNCFNAFWVGGLICSIGQLIYFCCFSHGLDKTSANTVVSIALIGISAFLTAINWFNRIGKFAGAGSLVPITGFANSIVAPAMEYKSEGYVLGVGAKMFTVAGPVLVFRHFGFCNCGSNCLPILGFNSWIRAKLETFVDCAA